MPVLNPQAAAPPAPPAKPPQLVLAELFERPTCRVHRNVDLSDEEVKKRYKYCEECRGKDEVLKLMGKAVGDARGYWAQL